MEEFNQFGWHKLLMHSGLSKTCKLVGSYLWDYGNAEGHNVRPGRELISEHLSMSKSTVDRSLKTLRDEGWIVRTFHGSSTGRRNMADEYELRMPRHSSPMTSGEPVSTHDECLGNQSSFQPNQSSNTTNQSSPMRQPVVMGDDPTTHEQPISTTHLQEGVLVDGFEAFGTFEFATTTHPSDLEVIEVKPEPVSPLPPPMDSFSECRRMLWTLTADEEKKIKKRIEEGTSHFKIVREIRADRDQSRKRSA